MFKKVLIAALAMIGAQAIKVDSSILDYGFKGTVKGSTAQKGSKGSVSNDWLFETGVYSSGDDVTGSSDQTEGWK